MDAYSSGEDLLIKTRKPYTITKQRERWTEEEHNRFLEALKLYGRAWQRIEEHIGTKTAVQIRSHAQKFFSKLEKEALVKGVPIGQAIDIEIPPPRPKRKPSNPYPRKTGAVSSPNIQKHVGDDVEPKSKEACGDDQCSQAFTLFHEAPSSLEASSNENSATALEASRKLSNFKEFVPVKKSSINDERTDVHAADGPNRNHQPDKLDAMEMVQNDASNQMHAAKIFPRHAPIQILDGSLGTCSQGLSSDVSYQEPTFHHHPALFSNPVVNPAVSATVESGNSASRPTNHHVYPSFHSPCHPFPNIPEDYSSFLQMSSTFSTLIVSALLQNPAAHAAASYAASFWPSSNVESSAHSPAGLNGGIASRPMNPSPSMAAIAAATVAAATAWWAAHGLLPLCAPLHAGFPFPPASISTPFANVGPTSAANEEREENNIQNPCSQVQQADQELSEARQPQNSPSKSSTTSSSDSGNSCGEKLDIGAAAACTEKKVPATIDQNDLCKGKSKKQVDRSSCGSNTPSGSDVETDALGKDDKEKEEPKEPDVNHSTNELSSRRNRIPSGMNDTWKEVSQGGRLAFQALFSRERLPQSFSPTNNVSSKEQEMNDVEKHRPNADGRNEEASQFDLNSSTWESVSFDKGIEKNGLRDEDNGKDGLLTISLSQGKLKSQRTGFKPYKRCSVEARDNRMGNSSTQEQENCPKRLRLQGEAST